MSKPPLGFDDGPNLYAYLRNNPLTHFDLYGLADEVSETPKEKTKETEANTHSHLKSDRFNRDERKENNTSMHHEVIERFKDIWRGFSDPLNELSEIADELRGGEKQRSFGSRVSGGVGVSLFAATAIVAGAELAAARTGVAALSFGRQALYAGGRALYRAATKYGFNKAKEWKEKTQIQSDQASQVSQPRPTLNTIVKDEVTIADKITGYTKHGLNQAISRENGRGVNIKDILDAIKQP